MMHFFSRWVPRHAARDVKSLDGFWTALRRGTASEAPADLADDVANVAKHLSGEIAALDASDAFVARVRAQLEDAHIAESAQPSPLLWTGPAVGPNSRRQTPVRETEEQQIMPASIDQTASLEQRRRSKELWKFAAAIAVFAVVGALLVLLLRDNDEPQFVQPGPTPTPTVVAATASAAAPAATVAEAPTQAALPPTVTPVPTEEPAPTIPSAPVLGDVVATIPVGGGPEAMTVGAGAIWVANELDGTVSRIDPATNQVVATIQVGSPGPAGAPAPPSIAVLGGEVWVLVNTDAMLVRIDPATNEVSANIALPSDILSERTNRYRGLAAGAGALWVTDDHAVQVVRVDPVSLAIVATIPGINGYGLLATDDAVWVAEYLDTATVYRIDPTTNAVLATIEVASGPIKLAAGFDSIWVTNLQAASLTRIDPATNSVVASISFQRINPEAPFPGVRDLAVDESRVWVGDVNDGGLYLVDPATDEVDGFMPTAPISAIVALDGSIWISDWENSVVNRIDPAR